MSDPILRIHPAIGIARVGNSDEYYLAPETIAALPVEGEEGPRTGGLPIRPGTESETIMSSELRDSRGRLKRQAARFRIYQYPSDQKQAYPATGAEEVVIGSKIGGRVVSDIVWTVHVANKKANWYQSPDDWGIIAYQDPSLGQLVLRNLQEGVAPENTSRRRRLVIDAGPRTCLGSADERVPFDRKTAPSFARIVGGQAEVVQVGNYPVSFPAEHFPDNMRLEPQGPIDTLGELQTDERGRLLITGGHGKTVGWYTDQTRPDQGTDALYSLDMNNPVNNDQWFDDVSDGPVQAIVMFEDGGPAMPVHGAWVVTSDPAYAPQTLNVVSLWDDVYDSFVRKLDLEPELYCDGAFLDSYRPDFAQQVQPIFKATAQQEYNALLPQFARAAHRAVGRISADQDPDDTLLANLAYVRNPNNPVESAVGAPLMPLSLGDATKAFLSPTLTQYFFLERWASRQYDQGAPARRLGPGEYLDRAALQNCLGGRFSPGIEITFICRQPELYRGDYRATGCGPFRIRRKALNYLSARRTEPFLTFGWIPEHPVAIYGVEPGDVSKFMALPWHADYNSCAIHSTAPNPLDSSTLYWSWPAQRPVSVHVAADVQRGSGGVPGTARATLPPQRYSVRGPGTMPADGDLSNAGRFWKYEDMLVHWQDIGTIFQATNIDDGRQSLYHSDWYLEVESRLEDGPAELDDPHPWPFNGGDDTAINKS